MIQRNTIQCSLVYDAVNRLQCHATADEVYREVAAGHPHISRGTVYRNLNRLAQLGQIRKIEIPGGPDRFDHRCDDHHHIRCEACGRVFDVDMPYLGALEQGVRNPQGFRFTGYELLFRGICPSCGDAPGKSLSETRTGGT
ncbi:Fur family transcriptional regulator [uncultured Oscillibacter sp.]|uniref:Fur family transcriptional regulator n=1 Tax=uncultured Oscillibacter sp. TaxID=876091 RepID=UPI0025EDB690|nr:transcriptional repressor [uncultured Oscillibacter sp.]